MFIWYIYYIFSTMTRHFICSRAKFKSDVPQLGKNLLYSKVTKHATWHFTLVTNEARSKSYRLLKNTLWLISSNIIIHRRQQVIKVLKFKAIEIGWCKIFVTLKLKIMTNNWHFLRKAVWVLPLFQSSKTNESDIPIFHYRKIIRGKLSQLTHTYM